MCAMILDGIFAPTLPHDTRAVLALEAMPARAVTNRPFVQDFACNDATACIVVNPGGGLTPPFACAYSEVWPGLCDAAVYSQA